MVWDREPTGFGVRVSPSGVKTYTVKYRLHTGRVRWKTIGRVDALALDRARRQAKDDIGVVARGDDPLEAKDAARDAVTTRVAAEQFLAKYVELKKPATKRLYRMALDQHIVKRLGAVPITDIRHTHAVALHMRLSA